jgi:hypothetical protein
MTLGTMMRTRRDMGKPIGYKIYSGDSEVTDAALRERIARWFDIPPWMVGSRRRPRFARVRWALRRVCPRLVWGR